MPHLGVTGHLEVEEVDHSGFCQRRGLSPVSGESG
jgi:hypothetical protein